MQIEQQQTARLRFLEKNRAALTQIVRDSPQEAVKAQILTQEQLELAANRIRNGQLVAFPTETVYGLGANAFDEAALLSIYQTKRRPLTDPIIVHVLDAVQGEQLVIMSERERLIFQLLTQQFWPGPLTVILKANLTKLPLIVTAQTGFVGIRAPKHPYARELIRASGLPIGAPSANLFSHVSPTEPVHVFNDFFDCPISIVDGDRCEFGVESTVVKLSEGSLHVLREGSLSVNRLQTFLKSKLQGEELPEVIVHRKVENKHNNMEAPGQLLKHYAPYLPCYYLPQVPSTLTLKSQDESHSFSLSDCAVISFDSKHFGSLQSQCKHYFQVGRNLQQQKESLEQQQLFCSKQQKANMREIYYLLRKCENLSVSAILIGWASSQEGTVWDKIFRSTQGQQALPQ